MNYRQKNDDHLASHRCAQGKQNPSDKCQVAASHIIPTKKKRCFEFYIQKWLCAIAQPRKQQQIKRSFFFKKGHFAMFWKIRVRLKSANLFFVKQFYVFKN